jgi:hypothetical protein
MSAEHLILKFEKNKDSISTIQIIKSCKNCGGANYNEMPSL